MRIIGFKLLKILAERFKDPSGSIQVSTNFSIPHFEKESFKDSSGKETAFGFDFTYILKYQEFAQIEFSGKIYAAFDKKIAKDLEKDSKDIPNDARTLLLNYILYKTHVETLHLEEKLNLPFHMDSPKVRIETKN